MATTASAQTRPLFNPQNPSFQPLSATEQGYAATAWAYFDANTDPLTGLVPSVRNFKSMTMWDQGAYLLATVSAYKLALISRHEASGRLLRVMDSTAKLPLYRDMLPNKAYNITTLQMTDYANRPVPEGIGWLALDIMRFMAGLLAATQTFPELLPPAQTVLKNGICRSWSQVDGFAALWSRHGQWAICTGRSHWLRTICRAHRVESRSACGAGHAI